ncbi:MAG TPA: BREX-2 system phosphatase PglZ [Actinomycetes bacterium]|nr:BREX-2 system phosphatase PglZ [Actinomycetes bacterium]
MPRADAAQIRALVAANRRDGDRRGALAVHADPVWSGPDLLDGPGGRMRVVPCASPLAVREALLDQERRAGELLVLLTPCSGGDLGLDIRARLVKGEVLPLDPFGSVLALFQAKVLDPELVAERWLIDDLIAIAPAGGWPDREPLAGVLDIDLAWRAWQQARLGLPDPPDGVPAVLGFSDRPEVRAALATLAPEQLERVAQRWAADATSPVPVMVDLLANGRGADLVALGLVAQVLWSQTHDAVLVQRQTVARARLEPLFGRDRLGLRAAAAWGAAAEVALEAHDNRAAVLDTAERVLTDAGAAELAILSDSLPRGFEERLAILGRSLAAGDLDAAVVALERVGGHQQATRRSHRVEMAKAAVRLLRRSQLPLVPAPTTFAAAVAGYAADGAWVDETRQLLAEGDQVPELASAYATLCDAADRQRRQETARFAKLLANWSRSEPLDDPRLLPVEHMLTAVVGPVAAAAPVLLVVCDGMGLPVAHVLLRDLLNEGWAPATPAELDGWPVGVAVLPTLTETSRTTLLCGQRTVGGQQEERAGFASHPALRAVSSPTRRPVLFHKADLVAPSGVALPDEVRRLVADPDQRVVGVVVNAVDDHLARGDQLRVGWDLVSLRPLSWLLDAAAEAGRVVVLTADHGHVLDGGRSRYRPLDGVGGERWRTTPPPAQEDEIEIAGPRVLLGGGRVVLAADDRLRYGVPKHGYHGGATPEEVLVPVGVLARRLPEQWLHRPLATPAWWTSEMVAPQPVPVPAKRPGRKATAREQPALFESPAAGPTAAEQPAAGRAGWVDDLLASPAFIANRRRARLPRPLADERLRRYLDLIDANGGAIPLAALSARTGEPQDTLRMALTLVQRLLNLDGAEVLAVRADGTVALNRELLALQFEVDTS